MAQLIKTDGTITEVTPKDIETGFTLQEVYDYIGCSLVEAKLLEDGTYMVMDEEGKLKVNDVNSRATVILRQTYKNKDVVVGNVIICNDKEFQ